MNINKYKIYNFNYLIPGIILSTIIFLFYLKTLAPTVVWGDSAKLATAAYLLDLDYTPDNHPLHSIVGSLFNLIPVGNIAFRQNLMSAFFAAMTVFLLYCLTFKITNSKLYSFSAALSLGISHNFWHLAVINETYSLLAFFFILLILILFSWQKNKDNRLLYLFFFLLGLSISNNVLMVLFIPVYIIYILSCVENKKTLIKNIFPVFISFLLGLSILIFLVISKHHNLIQALSHGAAIPFRRYYRSIYKILSEFIKYPVYLFYQFPILAFLLGIAGIKNLLRLDRKLSIFLLLLGIISIFFASGYMRQKQFYLLLPSYLVFAIFIGVGFNSIKNNFKKALMLILMVCLPVVLYYNCPSMLNALKIDLTKARTIPYRDNNRYFLLPDKSNYYGAYLYGKQALENLEAGSILIADFTPLAVIRYLCNVENRRCDAKMILDETIDIQEFVAKNINNYKIYLADLEPYYNIDKLRQKYNIIPKGVIFQINKRQD